MQRNWLRTNDIDLIKDIDDILTNPRNEDLDRIVGDDYDYGDDDRFYRNWCERD